MIRALFRPAVAALNGMNFFVKFVVIGLLLLLPFAYVTHLMVKGSDQQIAFNEKEVFGVDSIAPAFRLLAQVQDARLRALARDPEGLAAARAQIDVLLPLLDEVDLRHRAAFRTLEGLDPCSDRWIAIKAAWTALRERPPLAPAVAFDAYTALCRQVSLWIHNDVANYSNLILDPDLDSYWLMDAYVAKLPRLTEAVSQASARSLLLDAPRLEDRMALSGLATDARLTLDAFLEVNMATAYARRPALKERLDVLVQTARVRCGEFLETLQARVVVAERPSTSDLLPAAAIALDVVRELYERVGPELKSLIRARVDGYRQERTLGVVAAEVATFLHVYLFIAFYLAIQDSVRRVSCFTQKMIAGTTERFKLESRDELATVADSFNEINGTLNRTRALQAELQASEARFRSLAANAPVGIFMNDPQGGCVYANPHALRLAGLTEDEARGSGWESRLHPEDRERVAREWSEAVRKGGGFSSVYRFGDVWVSADAVPLRGVDGVLTGFMGSLADVTEARRVEKLKGEFISTVSHELRTPLTSIRGSLGLVANGVTGALPPKAAGMIDIAVKNCDRLVNLVNDILDIEKVASGKMSFRLRALELGALLKTLVESNRPYAASCGVRLVLEAVDVPLTVTADVDRLTQVLTNLVSNACKFSPRGETVRVRVRRAAGRARVEVEDRGPGIPEEFRGRIFQKFAQAQGGDAADKKGTGLGLAISKSLIEHMGGTIGFASAAGEGSTFHVELDERAGAVAVPAAAGGGRPRILVCEDEPDIAEVLAAMLDREGFDADVAMTLAEARTLLKRTRYAAMTLDLVMPDGHAAPFMRELRKDPATSALPLIVVSACMDDERRELDGQVFGIVDWLEKPFAPERLSKALGAVSTPGRRPRILHVEDDVDIRRVVQNLLAETAEVEAASTVLEAWEKLKVEDYDLLMLDVGLPDGSGLELLPALRKSTRTPIPSLVFSAHELSPRTANHVTAALLKSRTSNEELLRRIRSLLPGPVAP